MIPGILIIIGILLLVFVVLEGKKKKKEKKNVSKIDKLEIGLERLQVIWRGREKIEVALESLARIWKTYEEVEGEKGEDFLVLNFKNDDVLEFYVNYLRGKRWMSGVVRDVVLELLRLLDEKGSVSSVVKRKGEAYELDENSYALLSRVSLREHSLNVARLVLEGGVSGLYEPQAVVAALAHDLGKIPEFHASLYSLGDHAVISAALLDTVKGFNEFPMREEVRQAVLNHHRAGKGKVLEILKRADKEARRIELSQKLKEKREEEERRVDKQEEKREVLVEREEKREEVKKKEVMSAGEILREEVEEKVKERPGEYDVSWLDVRKLIERVGERVNVVKDGRWIAVSMGNGVVYVHPQGLWGVLKELARERNAVDVLMAEGDNDLKREILVSVVSELRREGYIVEGLIQDGYFAAPFYVYRKEEKEPSRVLYTPFRAEVFGMPSLLEERKRGTVLEKVEKIVPVYEVEEEG